MPTNRLTVSQVAAIMGVSVRRVQQLIQAGRLKAERFGPVWGVKPAAIAKVKKLKAGRPRKEK